MNWVVSLGAVERRDPMNLQKLSRFSFLCSFCALSVGRMMDVNPSSWWKGQKKLIENSQRKEVRWE